ncbi:MAG TPA: DUF1080 domain-containing protein [Gemmatimonadaceae bacterium]|nr:DUF1080 domain-containing protein [Gemmatimonadaceae bacterium]
MRPSIRSATPLAAVLSFAACAPRPQPPADSPAVTMSASSADRAPSGAWRPLFDGRSLAGWRGFRQTAPPDGWVVRDGLLARVASGGDLMTVEQFGDFELELEWRVQPGGNSGIIYRISGEGENTYESGLEMQVLDDAAHRDGKDPLTSAGALYGLYPAPRGVVKPAGEWNTARVVARGMHVEHWLNGQKVVDAEMWSPEFRERHARSKFTQWPAYAKATRGHIALQDHGDLVEYRNVRIRER